MADFDNLNPPKRITTEDTKRAEVQGYKHVHRFVPVDDKGQPTVEGAIVVAWKGKTPIYNEYRVVKTPDEDTTAAQDGFTDQPQLEEKTAKDGKAKGKKE